MALLFCDSFDHYASLTQKYATYYSNGGALTIVAGAGRNGGNGLQLSSAMNRGAGVRVALPNRATFIVGLALNLPSALALTVNPIPLVEFFDGTSSQIALGTDSSGTLSVFRNSVNGTKLGSSASGILPIGGAAFVYVEISVTFSATSGAVTVRVNGSNVISLSSVNTSQSGNAQAGMVALGNTTDIFNYESMVTWNLDDVYVCDTTGSHNNAFLGDVKITAVLPSGNGSTQNFTMNAAAWAASTVMAVGQQYKDGNNNIQRVTAVTGDAKTGATAPAWATTGGQTTVDNHVTTVVVGTGANPGEQPWMLASEIPPDGDASYLSDATVGDIERFTFPSVAGSTVFAAVVNMVAEKDDVGTRTIRAAVKSVATIADNGVDFALLENSYFDFQGIFETDPATGNPWTFAGVNAAEFGVKTTA